MVSRDDEPIMTTVATKYRLLAVVDYLTESLQQTLEVAISSSTINLELNKYF